MRNPDCELCSLGETTKYVCLGGQGPTPCKMMIMGEAPGRREDDVGKPFQGAAGRLLDELLESAGLHRGEVYITNAVRCRPPENRTPTRGEIKACSFYTQDEILEVQPEYILLLGATAMKAMLGTTGVKKHHGEVIEHNGLKYIVTYHPAAVLRNPGLRGDLQADIIRFKKLAHGELGQDHKLHATIVNSREGFDRMLEVLKSSDVVSYDLETNGLNPMASGAAVYVIGVATPEHQYVIPVDYPGSAFIGMGKDIVRSLSKVLDGKKLVAHNSKFDNSWLKYLYGWDVPTTFDTMLASYVLDENRRHGLKGLSRNFFHAPEYALPQPVDPNKVPLKKLAIYCAWDVYYTMELYHIFKEQLLQDKRLVAVFKYLIMPASKALEDVELHGVFIDRKLHGSAVSLIVKEVDQLNMELNEMAGRVVNWNSPKQVGHVLYDDMSLKVLKKTKTGAPSTDEPTLLQLRHESPLVDRLLRYREKTKLGQFLRSWGEHLDPSSRIHPRFLIHGTVTGRLSCRDPNLQQVPRDTFLRSLIRAPEGRVFVEADYSQVELRIAALVSRDEAMRRAFLTKQDIHRLTASTVMGVPPEEVTKEQRKAAKAVNFGFLYGMGWRKFKDYARDKYDVTLSEEESQDFRKRFFELFPGLPSWHDRQRRMASKHGYVRSPSGRKRRLPDIYSPDKFARGEAERQSINSPVQSFASDLTVLSMILLKRKLPNLQVVGLVHDAILMEIPEEDLDEYLPQVKRVMELDVLDYVQDKFGYEVNVPLEVEIKVGPWGRGDVYHENTTGDEAQEGRRSRTVHG